MKKMLAIAVLSVLVFSSFSLKNNNALLGSWIMEKDQLQHVLLFTNKHYSYTIYDLKGKKFHHTEGGTYSHTNSKLETILEFNSTDPGVMGKQTTISAAASNKELTIDWPVAGSNWKRIDKGGGPINATR